MDRIGILGTGRMGSGLARCFTRAGRSVLLGSRDIARAQNLAAQIREEIPGADIEGMDYPSAARDAEIVILAVPFSQGATVLQRLAAEIAGKIVVDITNPFGAVPPNTSGAETHATLLPADTTLVAAWKTNFWTLLDPNARTEGIVYDVFLCGDDEAAKKRIAALIESTGFRAVDCGKLAAARVLDGMVPLLIEMDARFGHAHRSAWKFHP